MGKRVKILVPGLEDEKLNKKMGKALDERDHIDYQCYMLLQELIEALPECPVGIFSEPGMPIPGGIRFHYANDPKQRLQELYRHAVELCNKRREANDKFIKAATGRA